MDGLRRQFRAEVDRRNPCRRRDGNFPPEIFGILDDFLCAYLCACVFPVVI
jgi:hypothetical protein